MHCVEWETISCTAETGRPASLTFSGITTQFTRDSSFLCHPHFEITLLRFVWSWWYTQAFGKNWLSCYQLLTKRFSCALVNVAQTTCYFLPLPQNVLVLPAATEKFLACGPWNLWKFKFWSPTPDLLNQHSGVGPAYCVSAKLLGGSAADPCLGPTAPEQSL